MTKKNLQASCGTDGLQLTLELALKVPLKEGERQSLMSAYAIIPRKMFQLLSRFLLRHEFHFKVAVLPGEIFAEKYLLRLGCGDTSPEPIPGFILAYINNLPFCHLFQGFAGPGEESLFLCEYGFNHPFDLVELVAETAAAGLYISFAGEPSDNLVIRPLPEFFSESSVLQYEVDFPLQQFDFVAQAKPEKLSLPVKFIDCKPSFSYFAPVLFLEGREISWLKDVFYRLPGSLFTKIEWAGSQESLFLFLNDSAGSSFFPFGRPFRKIAPNLFIPADKDLVPHLEPEPLHELFQVESDQYSFITDVWRRELPVAVKAPLSQLLTAAGDVDIEFKADSGLDGFLWESPAVIEAKAAVESVTSSAGFGARPAIPPVEQIGEKVVPAAGGGDCFSLVKESLKGYGGLLRRQGDLLGAATCFSLAEESLDAAACYAEAARALVSEPH